MPERLNGVIKQLEAGKHVHVCFGQPDRESALAVSTSNYDAVVFEMEHNPWDIAHRPCILKNVPGIGVILIGEGDLSQELGVPRQYRHASVVEAMDEVLARCKEANVPVGHPHVDNENIEWVLEKGYRWLMT